MLHGGSLALLGAGCQGLVRKAREIFKDTDGDPDGVAFGHLDKGVAGGYLVPPTGSGGVAGARFRPDELAEGNAAPRAEGFAHARTAAARVSFSASTPPTTRVQPSYSSAAFRMKLSTSSAVG